MTDWNENLIRGVKKGNQGTKNEIKEYWRGREKMFEMEDRQRRNNCMFKWSL